MDCGECDMCCRVPEILELRKPAGVLCRNYDCINKNCSIHDFRPNECKLFECAYYQMEKVSVKLRPDKCKIMFEKITDNLFYGTIDLNYELTDTAKKQIIEFGKQGFSTIYSHQGKDNRKLYLAEGHTKEDIDKEFSEYLERKAKWQLQHIAQI
jgi:hypothetical protein